MLLDIIDNLPRLRLSNAHLRVCIWMLKEAGCKNVPSLSTLRRIQADLNKALAVPTKKFTTSAKNIHYAINLPAQVAKDFANPLIRPHLVFYPEENVVGEVVAEAWQARKWLYETDLDHLTPMAINQSGQHFYVKEVTLLKDNSLVVPIRWVTRDGRLTADCFKIHKVS